eukprot:TRINITY_DN9234_c0_g1_i1.p1 TRINITY_DN9234_c0_g1~~TRINITY_DN9234_c0_g1_i1.p1  ORF type:complete len:299 (+),score=50.00 TRINITY_DN9234_c0_g1_i1:38-898(+)
MWWIVAAATGETQLEGDEVTNGVQIMVISITVAVIVGLIGVMVFLLCSDDDREAACVGNEMYDVARHYIPPCENCGQKLPQNKLCEGCQVVGYCSPECREVHEARHREVCYRLAALRNKHSEGGGVPLKEPANHASQRGYFVNWEPTKHTAILKDTAAYFVKHRQAIADCAVKNLPKSGRGLVLVDVSTERFKPLHKVEDPVRLMYLSAGMLANPVLSLLQCNKIKDLVTNYDPNTSAVAVFSNGLNYIERLDAHCPALILSHNHEDACRTIMNMTSSCIITRNTP